MNQIEVQKTGAGYSVATTGTGLGDFRGKAFVKELLGTTSVEVSLGSLAPGEAVPFFHHHKQNEEVYVVAAGEGLITLDGEQVAVASGSIVRVAPAVSRRLACTGQAPLVYLCIQGREGSLQQYTLTDGVIES